jgi:penicillin amidase
MSIQSTVITLGVLLALVALGGGFLLYIYWGLVQRPTPKASGRVELSALKERVEVLLDKHGIPHLYAQNEADSFMHKAFCTRGIACGKWSRIGGLPTAR